MPLLRNVQKKRGRHGSRWEHRSTVTMDNSATVQKRARLGYLNQVCRIGQGAQTRGHTIWFIPVGMTRYGAPVHCVDRIQHNCILAPWFPRTGARAR